MKNMMTILAAVSILIGGSLLAACGTSAGEAPAVPATGSTSSTAALQTNYADALPAASQLVLGTFKLDAEGAPLSADQVSQLLSLWKGYRALMTSSSTSPIELEGLLSQIENTYSEEQLKSIASLKLTADDTAVIAQELGVNMLSPQPGSAAGLTDEQRATRQALRQATGGTTGGGPGGGFPGGGGGFQGGGGMPPGGEQPPGGEMGTGFGPELMGTPGAAETALAQGPDSGDISMGLVNALIRYLESALNGGTAVPLQPPAGE